MSRPPFVLLTTLRKAALLIAALLIVTLAVLSLLGMRNDVGVLSGTRPSSLGSVAAGIAYAMSWFGAVVVAPPLLLFVAVDALLEELPRIGGWFGSRRR
jgi:hypothetical protein